MALQFETFQKFNKKSIWDLRGQCEKVPTIPTNTINKLISDFGAD